MTNTSASPLLVSATISGLIYALVLSSSLLGLVLPSDANPFAKEQLASWKKGEWAQTDFSKTTIDFNEIISGGPPKDGIPSIDDPEFVSLGKAVELGAMEPVVGLVVNGEAKAYPLRILMWHEIVNDKIGGVPVTVTYCPLCNSSIVFERRMNDVDYDFGTTGKLRHSDLVMYDRQTQSWWQQFTGEAIVGKMLGTRLKSIPSRLESFENFKTRFPDGKVLRAPADSGRDYGRNPYVNYDKSAAPFLYRGDMPEGISPMARVVVVESKGKKMALALTVLRARKEMQLGDVDLAWTKGQNSALHRASIKKGRDVGNVTARKKIDGQLVDIPYEVTFAFVFHAFSKGQPIMTEQ